MRWKSDRLEENEETGTRYAVLIYPEGEVPVKVEHLPEEVGVGCRLQYQPSEGSLVSGRMSKFNNQRNARLI